MHAICRLHNTNNAQTPYGVSIMKFYSRMQTQFCEVIIVGSLQGITHLHMQTGEGKRKFTIAPEWQRDDTIFAEARQQVEEYMAGTRQEFSLLLAPKGTAFQQQVWSMLQKIPYGETWTYKDIAVAIGNPSACRAVGAANGKNPIPLIIPCHRVIGTNGKLTGFAHGLAIKNALISHEKMTSYPLHTQKPENA